MGGIGNASRFVVIDPNREQVQVKLDLRQIPKLCLWALESKEAWVPEKAEVIFKNVTTNLEGAQIVGTRYVLILLVVLSFSFSGFALTSFLYLFTLLHLTLLLEEEVPPAPPLGAVP